VYVWVNSSLPRFEKFKEEEEKNKASDEASSTSGQLKLDRFLNKFESNDPRQLRLVKSIALNLIVDCDMPYSVVSRPGFLRHHHDIDQRYRVVDRYMLEISQAMYKLTIIILHVVFHRNKTV
jgi:hypothetical protein